MSDSRQARADAWLLSTNHLLVEGSNQTGIQIGIVEVDMLITHNQVQFKEDNKGCSWK